MDRLVTTRRNTSRLPCVFAYVITAVLIFMPVLSGQENDRAQNRSKALALEQQGQNAEAEKIWDGMVKSDPKDAEALAHLGLLEARQEHYEAAISYYRRAEA